VRGLCVVLLDGLGDRAYPELGGRSSTEAARTPSLDRLAARGSCGLLWPIGPGRVPSSEVAHWAMLGYRADEFPGRAVLEALGHGIPVRDDCVYAYAAVRRGAVREGTFVVTGRVRDDAGTPSTMMEEVSFEGITLRCHAVGGGEGVLELAGADVDDRVCDSDPFFRDRDPVIAPLPLVPAASLSAAAAEAWMRRTLVRDGDDATIATLKWWGRPRPGPTFLARHGVTGPVVGASPFLGGLAAALGLSFERVPDTGSPEDDLARRLEVAAAALDAGATFAWVHSKAVDEAGHTKDPGQRVRVLEALDPVLGRLEQPDFAARLVCVTGDHATPSSAEVIHSGDPVPLAIAGPGVRADEVTRFGELPCRAGLLGYLVGPDLMPVLLNAADRSLFAGSRPTRVSHPAGHPAAVKPLEL
jgi:2,3-bisphosphoglycerate-independent phosphoglycerate mutase